MALRVPSCGMHGRLHMPSILRLCRINTFRHTWSLKGTQSHDISAVSIKAFRLKDQRQRENSIEPVE